jgi:hypothetical protein
MAKKKKKKKSNWIADAIKRPGALHRALGIPMGKKIPTGKVSKASKSGGRLGKMANLAKTLSKFKKKKK